MNMKKYIVGSVIVFVVMYFMEFVFHAFVMSGQYELIGHILRPEAQMMTYMPAMVLGFLIYSFGFCYIFIKGFEGKGLAEGIRYGLWVGIAFGISTSLIEYAVYPLTGWIMLAYFIAYPFINMVLGAVIAMVYSSKK